MVLRVIRLSMMVAVALYGAVGWWFSLRGAPAPLPEAVLTPLTWVFLGITAALLPILLALKRRFGGGEGREIGSPPPAAARPDTRFILLFALAEMPGVFGLVLALLGAPPPLFLLEIGLSLFYLVLLSPPPEG
jgi:hypothetical protein